MLSLLCGEIVANLFITLTFELEGSPEMSLGLVRFQTSQAQMHSGGLNEELAPVKEINDISPALPPDKLSTVSFRSPAQRKTPVTAKRVMD